MQSKPHCPHSVPGRGLQLQELELKALLLGVELVVGVRFDYVDVAKVQPLHNRHARDD